MVCYPPPTVQVKEVIAYAADRFIEVIPEIELPGHCCAALACYPHLSCESTATQPRCLVLTGETVAE